MKKSVVAAAVQDHLNQINIDTSGDDAFLRTLTETWDDLNAMKDEMANAVLEFVTQVEEVTRQNVVMENLGNHKLEFDRLLNVFYTDIDGFTKTVENLRVQHENRSGRITTMDELNLYNALGMEYAVLNQKLMTLIAPTITSIILLVNEVTDQLQQAQPQQPQEGNNNV